MFALLCCLVVEPASAQSLPTLSVGNAAADEPDGTIGFLVRLSVAATSEVTVDYATEDVTAVAGRDYTATTGTLTFAVGEDRHRIVVTLLDDDSYENAETFSVSLSDPNGAMIADATGRGTIRSDDGLPTMSFEGSEVPESEDLQFVVTLSPASGVRAQVAWGTLEYYRRPGQQPQQARPRADYTPRSGTVNFAPGETSRTLRVSVVDDRVDEPEEFLIVEFTSPVNARFEEKRGTERCPYGFCTIDGDHQKCCACGFILDDDLVEISISDASGPENGPDLVFDVSLAARTYESVSVAYASSDASALVGEDYLAVSGNLTFPVGTVSETILVALVDDDRLEHLESFHVTLSSPVGGMLADAQGVGTITDDDAPVVSVADTTGVEGETVDFTVTLSQSVDESIEVAYVTGDGEALAGEDYEAAQGILTIAAGETAGTVTVELLDDDIHEPRETFTLTLTSAEVAAISTARATGTVVDDEDTPLVSINDAEGAEGSVVPFLVSIQTPSSRRVTVRFATSEGTATEGEDYRHRWGTVVFSPGTLTKRLSVGALDDDIDEPDETFVVELSSPRYAKLGDARGTGTIRDEDGPPALGIRDATGVEGGAAEFEVHLEGASGFEVAVDYATRDGTATAGSDYQAVSGRLTFAPGEVRRTLSVALTRDALDEPDETFRMVLSSASNAVLGAAQGTGTIRDADERPVLSIGNASGVEGEAAKFPVRLDSAGAGEVAVDYATLDGTASAGSDYEETSGRMTFAPGDLQRTVSVALLDDDLDEPAETFTLTLSSATGATIGASSAAGTIVDNDGVPQVSVRGASAGEGEVVVFTVSLAGTSDRSVAVSYATQDGSAVAGEDYRPASGALTFATGETSRTVSVAVLDDAVPEPEESFALELSSPTNATLAVSRATGTILDDDKPPAGAPTKGEALLFETRSMRQGFVRIVNHSDAAGEFQVEGIDDAGWRVGPLTLTIGARAVRHFNSDDFETGNAEKGIPVGVGRPGVGSWRLEFSTALDIEVLAYARTPDGLVTSLHDTVPSTAGMHRSVFLNPGGNENQLSRLRLINPATDDARVTITGTDDSGGMSAEVAMELPKDTAREWTAAELEAGVGMDAALGEGEGKWRLQISSDPPVVAMSLIENPTGHLANLSTLPRTPGRSPDSHLVPLFPSASDALGRQGFVRVANRSAEAVVVRIEAFDRTEWTYDPLTLEVGAGVVASFNSDDLELGAPEKGLVGSTGSGEGDWWLELSSDGDIEVGVYVRTTDGFLTTMHDLVPKVDGFYRVVFFNPAENENQVSVLWLVNAGDADTDVTITGTDDEAAVPGTTVRLRVPAGSARRFNAVELETGVSESLDAGALGDGVGKWRLRVESETPIRVMSLMENPTGHLTNLSTTAR